MCVYGIRAKAGASQTTQSFLITQDSGLQRLAKTSGPGGPGIADGSLSPCLQEEAAADAGLALPESAGPDLYSLL